MKNGFFLLVFLFLLFSGLLSFQSCNNKAKPINLTNYYFPFADLHENNGNGMVYIYRVQIDTVEHLEYWYYKSFDNNGKTFLSVTQFDEAGNVDLLMLEEFVSNGTVLTEMRTYVTDSNDISTFTQAAIEHGDLFPFVADPEIWYILNVKYRNPADTLEEIRWIRNRSFIELDEYIWFNDTIRVAVFKNMERFEMDHPIHGSANPESQSVQFFAENIGLVFYEKKFGDYLHISGTLVNRMSMEDFLVYLNSK